jgi:hypothetical protein
MEQADKSEYTGGSSSGSDNGSRDNSNHDGGGVERFSNDTASEGDGNGEDEDGALLESGERWEREFLEENIYPPTVNHALFLAEQVTAEVLLLLRYVVITCLCI